MMNNARAWLFNFWEGLDYCFILMTAKRRLFFWTEKEKETVRIKAEIFFPFSGAKKKQKPAKEKQGALRGLSRKNKLAPKYASSSSLPGKNKT